MNYTIPKSPKNMKDAIENGILEANGNRDLTDSEFEYLFIIEKNVREHLANKFTQASIDNMDLRQLFFRIFGESDANNK